MSVSATPLAQATDVNWVVLSVFIFLFAVVSVMGFVASRWRRAESLDHLDEWGLGGRNFGPWVSWFLIGGDLYTAYTFVAVPALLFGAGALGFFAVPYTIMVFPIAFVVGRRLWSVAHRHGYVTPADFVRGRHGSATLALVIALTGIVATMPYIALQLVGIEAVMRTMGVEGDLPIIIAFVILAAYTYQSGLRAPALIAFVKDTLIYIVVIGRDHRTSRSSSAASTRSSPRPTRSSRPASRPATACCSATRRRSATRRWPSAQRSRCSSTRTRSPACWPPAAATRSGATWPRCPPTASCSGCSRCSA